MLCRGHYRIDGGGDLRPGAVIRCTVTAGEPGSREEELSGGVRACADNRIKISCAHCSTLQHGHYMACQTLFSGRAP